FSNNRTKSRLTKKVQEIIASFVNLTSNKALNNGHLTYLINRVLIPKIVYLAQLSKYSEGEWSRLFSPILKLVKSKLGLASSFPTASLFHDGILGIISPWKALCIKQTTDLLILLNEQSIASSTTQIRLRGAQLKARLTTPIFDIKREDAFLLRPLARS